jgi:outer membrane protein
MRSFTAIFVLLLFTLPLKAQEEWTLEQCIDQALKNNIAVKQSALGSDINRLTYMQNRLSLLPNINGSASHGYNTGRAIDPTTNLFETREIQTNTFGLQSGITLFNGLTKINTIRQGKYDYQASQADLEKMQNDITLQVASSFLTILFNKEMVRLAEEQLKVSQEQLDRTKRLVDAGALPEGDRLQMQAQLETDKLNRINAVNQLKLSVLNLMILMQIDLSKQIDVAAPELSIPSANTGDSSEIDDIFRAAESTQPSIRSVELKKRSFAASLAIARGSQSPTISAFANVGTNYSNASQRIAGTVNNGFPVIGFDASSQPVTSAFPDFDFVFENTPFSDQLDENFRQTFGLNMSIPIFNAGATRIAIQKAKIGMQTADLNMAQARQQLMQDVYTAYNDANAAGQRYVAAKQSVDALEKAFGYTDKKFEAGLVNFFEYINSKNTFTRAQSELLQAKYEYIFKLKILDFYQGKPITLN